MKVQIRMYAAGLGDCFLLTFEPGPKAVHVLVDCGVLVGTPQGRERIRACVDDILTYTKRHLHVVVATHEHWDHVSGFDQAADLFGHADVQIDEVWFAWTEKDNDHLAKRLREDREQRIERLRIAATLWAANIPRGSADGDPSDPANRLAITQDLLSFAQPSFHPDAEALGIRGTTKDALDFLRMKKDIAQYLEPGTIRAVPETSNVKAYVLGPPRNEKLLKRGKPSKKSPETFVESDRRLSIESSFFDAVNATTDPASQPFDPMFRVDTRSPPRSVQLRYLDKSEAWRNIDHDWLAVTSDLALALDEHTNNTSLVLAFELGDDGDVLLFPADAQVGNWLSWQTHTFEARSGRKRRIVTVDDLLARTVFYKVGHHASHNATLRAELEKMRSPRLAAMIPVQKAMAKKLGWAMPFPPLYDRLLEKCGGRVLMLDDHPDVVDTDERFAAMSKTARKSFRKRVSIQKDLYVQLEIVAE